MHVTFQSLGSHGRLGNQLFQIAATLGAACRNHCDFILPPWEYSPFFEHPLPQSNQVSFEETHDELDFSYRPIDVRTSTNLWGFFQSERYFEHCRDELRYYLTPNDKLLAMIERDRQEYFHGVANEKTGSISVRRGDYIGHPGFVELARTTYYRDAISQFDSKTLWFVFSDEIDWCKTYFSRPEFSRNRFVFVRPCHELAGLFLMASCQYNVIANSSYPWWSAWLNCSPDKRVIAPDAWFSGPYLDRSRRYYLERGFHDTKDLIPVDWEKIHVVDR